ncbi:hypothetical protein Pla163_04060 [Planctomycetes bacterium Pla163]|uniref:Uncharacterized protein n=1 Tax=Rohdeia mirabilis TaxID=2528008 RepID=A0A518CVT5_9BACT|nr:hypothetical protein Pla163_04060 [Planctomycetes bacterium Pla163]
MIGAATLLALAFCCTPFAALPLVPSDAEPAESAEQEDVELGVVVTGVAGDSVFVDVGRDGGLEPGDRVQFEPAGRPVVIGEVRSVSSTSARVELVSGGNELDVGDGGVVRVPLARLQALVAEDAPTDPTDAAEGTDVPEHPPWTLTMDEWGNDLPLLAPPRAATPSEREIRTRGRYFLQADRTWDREGGRTTSTFTRGGLDASWENLFGEGGMLELDAEIVMRRFETELDSDDETQLRLQRFSYAVGGDRQRPTRVQVGRFLQRGFVEFGLLDGIEVARRGGSGDGHTWTLGGSLGLLPEPSFDLNTGRDAQIALFARRDSTQRTGLSYGVGYQKSFHDAAADRDLLAFDADWRPTEHHSVHASALVDWYTSGERALDAGPDLTELHVFGTWRPDTRSGVSLSLDRTRPPDIDRAAFAAIPPDLLREQLFERVGLRGWHRLTDDLRITARVDAWRNQDDDGGGAELRLNQRDLFWKSLEGSATVFANDGTFTSIRGLRLGLDQTSSIGRFNLAWELVSSEQDGVVLGNTEQVEQTLRAGWDHSFGRTSTSLYAEHFFGDGRDATSAGFYLQWRL